MIREARILHVVLRRIAFRLALCATVRALARASAALALALWVWALLSMAVPIPFPLRSLVAAGAAGLALAGVVLIWRRWPVPSAAARIADRRLGLADRVSTAVGLLARGAAPAGLARLQIVDAAEVAEGVAPGLAAPVRCPREVWITLALAAAILLWAHYLQGWTVPGLPAARTAAVIHFEGRSLFLVGRQLESAGRGRGLPEARRAARDLLDLGRRLQAPRITRSDALRLLQDMGRRLEAAQSRVERRLGADADSGAAGPHSPGLAPSAGESTRLHQTLQQLETLTGRLRSDSDLRVSHDDIAQRLGEVAQSLDRINAPISTRRDVATARRELEQGRPGSAASALGDAMQDLEGMDRMLGDDQALGEAKREVDKSADRVAKGGPAGPDAKALAHPSPDSTSDPQAPGPNPVARTSEDGAPPPPGPNQGSRPGQGRGGRTGPPTPRLGGTRVEQHLAGRESEGTTVTRDLLAPGRGGTPRLPVAPLPAEVAHQNDRVLAQDPLPPAYRTLIRDYFSQWENGR